MRRTHVHRSPFLVAMIAIVMLAAMMPALAQNAYTPARGTSERKAILNAVRPLVEARLAPPVEFVVDRMLVAHDWAFVTLSPQRPGGRAIDLSRTPIAPQAEYLDGVTTYALLRYAYGQWNIIDFVIGPTDVFWHGDPLYNQVPRAILPY